MCYTIVGISMGIVAHRMGLPLTIRSGLFPIFGKYVFGWFGDLVDALSIFTTLFAICTSMGVGAIQINTGLNLLFGVKQSNLVQVILIALMTVLGGISAHAGLKRGVRVLSILTFCTMSALAFMVLLLDDTTYLLNLLVQSFGYHIQHIMDLGFYSDAFEQLNIVVDKKSGPAVWMDWWTVFYWSWWVSWSPFVGMFIAKISKGRTVREIINASLTGPVLFNVVSARLSLLSPSNHSFSFISHSSRVIACGVSIDNISDLVCCLRWRWPKDGTSCYSRWMFRTVHEDQSERTIRSRLLRSSTIWGNKHATSGSA